MRGGLRHRLRKLWAAGLLRVGGKLPPWMRAEKVVEEASAEDVRNVLATHLETRPVLEALTTGGCVVGMDRQTGRLLVSGEGCLPEKNWLIVKRGTQEECLRYTRGIA